MHQKNYSRPDNLLARLNVGLACLITVCAVYVLMFPLLPEVTFWWRTRQTDGLPAASITHLDSTPDERLKTQETNRLIIPSMLLDEPIFDGLHADTLRHGIWVRPASSSSPETSNTILAGHRFRYTDRAVFYHLDKVSVGDQITLLRDHTRYDYEVISTTVVSANQTEVEDPTDQPTLTLYTCTPLWNPVNRLVVQARLLSPSEVKQESSQP